MKFNRPLANLLFISLPIFLLTTPSYASMGDISICFPFFLLLALLMAGMIAQGRSPLVGFDISITRPPAEIKSTSYKFKSYGSGGFDTVAKMRDQTGGGNYLTRGLGWTLNKATGSKYQSLRTMADRGALYAITSRSTKMQTLAKGVARVTSRVPILAPEWKGLTKGLIGLKTVHIGKGAAETGIVGGGYETTLEREKLKKTQEVKSLRQMLAFAIGESHFAQMKNRVRELEAKKKERAKKGKRLKAVDAKELRGLKEELAARGLITDKQREATRLTEESKKRALTGEEAARLRSLKKELGSLEARYKGGVKKSEIEKLRADIREAEKKADTYDVALVQMEKYRKSLAEIGGIQGRLRMMAYAPAAAAGFTYAGARFLPATAYKYMEKKEVKKKLDKIEDKREKLRNLVPSERGKDYNDKLKKLADDESYWKRRYETLSKPSTLSTIFNPDRISKRGVALETTKRYGKRILLATPWRLFKDNIPASQFITTRLKAHVEKPGLEARLQNVEDRQLLIGKLLNQLKDPSISNTEKNKILGEIRQNEKELQKQMKTSDSRIMHRALLSGNSDKLNDINKDIKKKSGELEKIYKKWGLSASILDRAIESDRRRIDKIKGEMRELEEKGRKDTGPHRKLADDLKKLHASLAQKRNMKEDQQGLENDISNMKSDRDKLLFGDSAELEKIAKSIKKKTEELNKPRESISKVMQKMRELEENGTQNSAEYKKLADELKILHVYLSSKENTKLAKKLEGDIKELESQRNKLLLKTTSIVGEFKSIQIADNVNESILKEKKNIRDRGHELVALKATLSDPSLPAPKRIDVGKTLKELRSSLEKSQKELKKLEAERKKLEDEGTIPTRNLKRLYEKVENFDIWMSDVDKLTKEQERASAVGTARLIDTWRAKVKESRGRWNPEALAIKAIDFGKSGIEKTQELRHIASTWENVIGPMLAQISEEERKRRHLMKMLGKEQEEIQAKHRKLKHWFSQDTLYARRNKLQEEIGELGKSKLELDQSIQSTSDETKMKQLEARRKQIETRTHEVTNELKNTNALIADTRMQLSKREKNINKLLDSFLIQDALLEYRRKEFFEKEREEPDYRIARLDEKLEKDHQNKDNIEKKMKILESEGKKKTKEYVKLEGKFRKSERSIREKEGDKRAVESEIEARGQGIDNALAEKLEKTIIRVGGEQVLRDRDRLRAELTMAMGGALTEPTSYVVSLVKNMKLVEDKDKLKAYLAAHADEFKHADGKEMNYGEKLSKYYSQHNDEYAADLRKTYSKLKKKWDNLRPISAAEWVHQKMEEVGDNRRGRESGLYRERYELDALRNNKKFEEAPHLLKEYVKDKHKTVENILYLAGLEFGGVINPGTAAKYDKLVRDIEEQRMNVKSAVDSEIKELDMRMKMIEDVELKQVKESGWKKEEERLTKHLDELNDKKKTMEGRLSEIQKSPGDQDGELEKLKKMDAKLTRIAHMHKAAELLQREEYSKHVGGLMEADTKDALQLLKEEHPGYRESWEGGKESRFWQQAKEWADMTEKKHSESVFRTYEGELVKTRNEVREISSKIYDIELKHEHGTIPLTAEEKDALKSLYEERGERQKELNSTHKELQTVRDYYRSVYEPFRVAEKLTGPGSERELDKVNNYLKEFAEEDVRNRFGVGRLGGAEHLGETVSKAVENIATFSTRHGSKVLTAAAIAAPFAIPFLGAAAAAALTGGAIATYGAKTVLRKEGEWEMKGFPSSTEEEGIGRIANKMIAWSSHLTARGSGAPPKTYAGAWESQVFGTEYISKGLRLDEYGRLQAAKARAQLPSIGLPWFIRAAESPLEGLTSVASSWAKRSVLRMEYPGGEDAVKRVMAENPKYIPEISEKIQYQYIKMFGSIEPIAFPKQAWEMTEYKTLATEFPYQEQARGINPMRDYAADPLREELLRRKRQLSGARLPGVFDVIYARAQVARREQEHQIRMEHVYNKMKY